MHNTNLFQNNLNTHMKGSQKKVLILMAGPLRGGGGKGPTVKEKKLFL